MPSFPESDDQRLITLIQAIKEIGAEVSVTTTESAQRVQRTAVVTWDTHSPKARVLR